MQIERREAPGRDFAYLHVQHVAIGCALRDAYLLGEPIQLWFDLAETRWIERTRGMAPPADSEQRLIMEVMPPNLEEEPSTI